MCNFHILCSCSKNCFSTSNLSFLGSASNLCDLANVPEVFDFLNFFLLPEKTDLGLYSPAFLAMDYIFSISWMRTSVVTVLHIKPLVSRLLVSVNSSFNLMRSSHASCKDTHGGSLQFESSQILSTCFFSLDCMFFVFFLVFLFIFSSFLHLLPSACVLGLAGCRALESFIPVTSISNFVLILHEA